MKKFWLNSLTIRATILGMIPTIVTLLGMFHVQIATGEQQAIISGIMGVFGLISAVAAIYGRFKAGTPLTTSVAQADPSAQ